MMLQYFIQHHPEMYHGLEPEVCVYVWGVCVCVLVSFSDKGIFLKFVML